MPLFTDFVPTPKQAEFLKNPALYKLFGGSMGSGKSTVLCAEAIRLSLTYPRNRGYICRYEYKSFKSTTLVELMDMLPGNIIKSHNKTDGEILLTNGSLIMMGGLENAEKLKSLNLGWFAIDEATQTTREVFHMLLTRLRLSHIPPNRLFALLATNPEPGWIKDDFVDPQVNGHPLENHAFIQALPEDNPYLPPTYISNLRKQLKPLQVAKYLEGSWDVFESQIFIPDYIKRTMGTPKFETFVIAIDPAITENDDIRTDETAICVVGIEENGNIHEVETRHGKWSFETILNNCIEVYNYYKPDFIGVEKVAFQAALQQELNNRNVPAIPLKADGDKTRRAYSIQHMFENGKVFINNEQLTKQMLEFPVAARHGGHEDLVDALVYCLIMIKKFSMDSYSEKPIDKYSKLKPEEKAFWLRHEQELKNKETNPIYDIMGDDYGY